ncbi:hypothetical protein GCM10010896_07380 [Mammaliicoccus stepanovicii]|nr:hypothetical protein GCM10010896_07380 [Mammaliicoccus stepanovicii]
MKYITKATTANLMTNLKIPTKKRKKIIKNKIAKKIYINSMYMSPLSRIINEII